MRKNKRVGGGQSGALKRLFVQPDPKFYLCPMLHIRCGGTIEVEGCRAVLDCTGEQIRLDMGRWVVTLCGDGLCMESMNRRCMVLRGRVLDVSFSYKEGR